MKAAYKIYGVNYLRSLRSLVGDNRLKYYDTLRCQCRPVWLWNPPWKICRHRVCGFGKDRVWPWLLCSSVPPALLTLSSNPCEPLQGAKWSPSPPVLWKAAAYASWFILFADQFELYCLTVWSRPTCPFKILWGFALIVQFFSHIHLCTTSLQQWVWGALCVFN